MPATRRATLVRLRCELRAQLQATLNDGYTLERELGGGGMSRVFVAHENALGRTVVVKVIALFARRDSLGAWPLSIWYHRNRSTAFKSVFDAILYGVATGMVFSWLWPTL